MTQPAVVAPPIQLVNRSCVITVGSVEIDNIGQQVGLDCWFHVRRSLRPKEPNTCDLRIYNLSDDSRKAIESSANGFVDKNGQVTGRFVTAASVANLTAADFAAETPLTPVKIEAGYVNHTSVIFLGEMRSAQTMMDGPDTVTELTTGDGDFAAIIARLNMNVTKGSNAYTVAKAILAAMKLGPGNLESVANVLRQSPLYGNGVVLKGNAMAILKDLASAVQLEVSIQGGVAQFLSLGQPLAGQAYEISSDTGMIGTPSVDTKGNLTVTTLMIPGLTPGCPIQMNAKYVQGLFRVISMETTGDTHSTEWQHLLECRKYGTGLG